jgi:hypothetical protein
MELPVKKRVFRLVLLLVSVFLFGGLINAAPVSQWINKVNIFVISLIIATCFYYACRVLSSTEMDETETTDKEEKTSYIPPPPRSLPTITAEKTLERTDVREVEEFEIIEEEDIPDNLTDNLPLYRYRFSIMPVIFKMVVVVIVWCGLLYACLGITSSTWWSIFVGATLLAIIYCYYLALRWNGEEFIVNDEWYERPRTMPSPFTSKTPAIRRTEIGSYNLEQTFVDKILRTCRLRSDTASKGDEIFHLVKWLTHPTELRRATGISTPRKNSYLFFFKKRR